MKALWATRYGRVLAAWMALCVLSILLLGPVSELAPLIAGRFAACVIVLPVIPLLAGAIGTRSWRGALHRSAYERILADAKAGRLSVDEYGLFRGRRYGVAASVGSSSPLSASFDWGDPDGFFGVVYGPECAGARSPSRTAQPSPQPAQGDTPIIKNAGLMGPQWPLGGQWCLMRVVW